MKQNTQKTKRGTPPIPYDYQLYTPLTGSDAHNRPINANRTDIAATRRAGFKTNDAGTRFTVSVFLNRLRPNYQSSETAAILREIADRLDRADVTATRAQETSIL